NITVRTWLSIRALKSARSRELNPSTSISQTVLVTDIAVAMTEALRHDRGEVLAGIGHPAAGAHGVARCRRSRARLFAPCKRTGRAHQEFAKLDHANVGRAKVLAGAVVDWTLAILDSGVLLAYTGDAGEGIVLLHRAID